MNKDIVISLFDKTGKMVQPWYEAGYKCYIVDIQHDFYWDDPHIRQLNLGSNGGSIHTVRHDLSHPWLPPFDINRVKIVFAFPPCDHLSYSGNRWHRGKGLRALAEAITLFATAAEMCEFIKAPYMIENPESKIELYWRKHDHDFHPAHYNNIEPGDNYTKKTCLWVGNDFVMPRYDMNEDLFEDEPDNRIHFASPSQERSNVRAETPVGFSRAVYEYNR